MTVLDHDWFPRPLPEGTAVGERSWLYSSYAFHHCHGSARIGSDCGIYKGTHFELGPAGSVEIGRYTTIVGATIRTNGFVGIGDHVFVAHEVVIADTPFVLPPDGSAEPRSDDVLIGSGAWIGARAMIIGGARIGDDAVIGAGAVVSGPVPAGATVAGNPARVVGR